MAALRKTLKTSSGNGTTLIGISCHLKSYRLSYALNTALHFKFRRIPDLDLSPGGEESSMVYPFLEYHHPDLKNHFCLVGNHHPYGKLIPSLKQVDYFLIAKNPLEKSTAEKITAKIRAIPQVQLATEIDTAKVKKLDEILEILELHLMESMKGQA